MTDLAMSLKMADFAWACPTLTRGRTDLYISEQGYETWVCFNSSNNLNDLIDHLQAIPVAFKGHRVHKGWLGAYMAIEPVLRGIKNPVFCGHSLGGALAQIATLDKGGRFVTTASPRPWYGVAPELDGIRYEVQYDIIPYLYPWLNQAGQVVKLKVGANIFNAHFPKTYKKGII